MPPSSPAAFTTGRPLMCRSTRICTASRTAISGVTVMTGAVMIAFAGKGLIGAPPSGYDARKIPQARHFLGVHDRDRRAVDDGGDLGAPAWHVEGPRPTPPDGADGRPAG